MTETSPIPKHHRLIALLLAIVTATAIYIGCNAVLTSTAPMPLHDRLHNVLQQFATFFGFILVLGAVPDWFAIRAFARKPRSIWLAMAFGALVAVATAVLMTLAITLLLFHTISPNALKIGVLVLTYQWPVIIAAGAAGGAAARAWLNFARKNPRPA